MALGTLQDRDLNSFVEKADGTPQRQVTDTESHSITKRSSGYFTTRGTPQIVSVNNVTPVLAVGLGGPLTNRSGVFLQANSSNQFFGFDSGVTSANGFSLPNGTPIFVACSEAISIFIIKTGANSSCRVWEVGAP